LTSTSHLRRLRTEQADLETLRKESSLVTFRAHGEPPTRYEVELSCRGLAMFQGVPLLLEAHRFTLLLGSEFPLAPPTIVWYTPIYHPNFRPPAICIGDHWYPAWSVAKLCEVIVEMVQYKTFNIYDPLNKEASEWLSRSLEDGSLTVPIDSRAVRDLCFDIHHRQGS
jgi:ubiquitin-protein ligase